MASWQQIRTAFIRARTARMYRGGKAFVATQAMGWALFSIALSSLAWLIAQVAMGLAYCVQCWVVMTSSVMLAAQLVSPPP